MNLPGISRRATLQEGAVMLVLSRKVGQRIVIDNRIEIVINRVAGNRVSIGIEAPKEVPILRGELQEIRDAFSSAEPEEGIASSPKIDLSDSWDLTSFTLP